MTSQTWFILAQIDISSSLLILMNPEKRVSSHKNMQIQEPIISTNKQPVHSSSKCSIPFSSPLLHLISNQSLAQIYCHWVYLTSTTRGRHDGGKGGST